MLPEVRNGAISYQLYGIELKIWGAFRGISGGLLGGLLTSASKNYDFTGICILDKQAKLVRPAVPKSKIWGVLEGYPLFAMP